MGGIFLICLLLFPQIVCGHWVELIFFTKLILEKMSFNTMLLAWIAFLYWQGLSNLMIPIDLSLTIKNWIKKYIVRTQDAGNLVFFALNWRGRPAKGAGSIAVPAAIGEKKYQ